MQKFCYKCGKQPEDNNSLIENLCIECYKEINPLLKIPSPLKIKLCEKCNRYYIKNRWISSHYNSLEQILDYVIKESIPFQLQTPPQSEVIISTKISENLETILNRNLTYVDIVVTGKNHESQAPYTETYEAKKVQINFTICPSCLSLKRGEYQSVFHILAPSRELTEKEQDLIFSIIEKENYSASLSDPLSYISKFSIKRGKMTFYLGSEKLGRALASIIRENLGGSIKETYKFGSKKMPKEIKRNKLYISLYLPPFIQGDLLQLNNLSLYVTKIKGQNVNLTNLINQEHIKIPIKNLKNVEILRHLKDIRTFLYFAQTKEQIQLMDLQNYQIYEMSFPKNFNEFEIGKLIKGFEINGQIYLLLNIN